MNVVSSLRPEMRWRSVNLSPSEPLLFERSRLYQSARGMIGNGQAVAAISIAELELFLEVGTPQIVGSGALQQPRAARGGADRRCA